MLWLQGKKDSNLRYGKIFQLLRFKTKSKL